MKTICVIEDHKLFSSGLELMISSLEDGISCQVFDDAAPFLQPVGVEAGELQWRVGGFNRIAHRETDIAEIEATWSW